MKRADRPGRARRPLAGFGAAAGGTSAIEFAVMMPLLFLIVSGVTGIGLGFTASRKVAALGYEIGDLVAEDTAISQADLTDIFASSSILLPPVLQGNLSMRIMSVKPVVVLNVVVGAQVDWCQISNPSGPLTCPANNSVIANFPLNLLPSATSTVIQSDVRNNYTGPVPGYPGGLALTSTNYFTPRASSSVVWEN